jgi:hypothetical protein
MLQASTTGVVGLNTVPPPSAPQAGAASTRRPSHRTHRVRISPRCPELAAWSTNARAGSSLRAADSGAFPASEAILAA